MGVCQILHPPLKSLVRSQRESLLSLTIFFSKQTDGSPLLFDGFRSGALTLGHAVINISVKSDMLCHERDEICHGVNALQN